MYGKNPLKKYRCALVGAFVLLACVSAPAGETIRLGAKDFAPHFDKNYNKENSLRKRGPYIQMRMWSLEEFSEFATARFSVSKAGFYEVWFERLSAHATAEVWLDGRKFKYGKKNPRLSSYGPFRHFTVYLNEGGHILRLKAGDNYAVILGVELRPTSHPAPEDAVLLVGPRESMTFRRGEKIEFRLLGCPNTDATLKIVTTGAYVKKRQVFTKTVSFGEDSKTPFARVISFTTREQGVYEAYILFGDGKKTFESIEFCVVDTTVLPTPDIANESKLKLRLIDEIDCADPKDKHFYVGDDECRIVEGPSGKYRESGPGGIYEKSKDLKEWPEPHSTSHKGWFGYRYKTAGLGVPHIIEVDYPDDAWRDFIIITGETIIFHYMPASQVTTGIEYPLTGKMLTTRFIVWPRTKSPDIHVLNTMKHSRAAMSKIRVYAVEGGLPAMGAPAKGFGGRKAGWFFFEPRIADLFYGNSVTDADLAPRGKMARYNTTRQSVIEAADHFGEYARFMGFNTMFSFNPVDRGFYKTQPGWVPTPDELERIVVLKCGQYGIDYIKAIGLFTLPPTLMEEKFAGHPAPKPHFQVSRDGRFARLKRDRHLIVHATPGYDPLHPAREEYLRHRIARSLERYSDCPAFKGFGFSLAGHLVSEDFAYRSIHWGYSDYDIGLFEKDTGVKVPVGKDDPEKYRKRFDWLMANKKKDWIDWRCRKIEEVLLRTIKFARSKRPGIKFHFLIHHATDFLYLHGAKYNRLSEKPGGILEMFRGKGFDLERLARHPEIVINAPFEMADSPVAAPRPGPLKGPARICSGALIYSHLEYASDKFFGQIRHKENSALYSIRKLYPEFEKFSLPHFITGDARHGGHDLAGFAQALVWGDKQDIMTGGDANTALIEPSLRGFLRKYRSLPGVGFTPYPGNAQLDPVALWSGKHESLNWVYVVNRAEFPVKVKVLWKGSQGFLADSVTGAKLAEPENGELSLNLEFSPYGLKTYFYPGSWKVLSVKRELPEKAVNDTVRRAIDIDNLLTVAETDYGEGYTKIARPVFRRMMKALENGRMMEGRDISGYPALRDMYRVYGYPEGMPGRIPKETIEGKALWNCLADKTHAKTVPWGDVFPEDDPIKTHVVVSDRKRLNFNFSAPRSWANLLEVFYANGEDFGPLDVYIGNRLVGTVGETPNEKIGPRRETLHVPVQLARGSNRLAFVRKGGSRTGLIGFGFRETFIMPSMFETPFPKKGSAMTVAVTESSRPVPGRKNVFRVSKEIRFNEMALYYESFIDSATGGCAVPGGKWGDTFFGQKGFGQSFIYGGAGWHRFGLMEVLCRNEGGGKPAELPVISGGLNNHSLGCLKSLKALESGARGLGVFLWEIPSTKAQMRVNVLRLSSRPGWLFFKVDLPKSPKVIHVLLRSTATVGEHMKTRRRGFRVKGKDFFNPRNKRVSVKNARAFAFYSTYRGQQQHSPSFLAVSPETCESVTVNATSSHSQIFLEPKGSTGSMRFAISLSPWNPAEEAMELFFLKADSISRELEKIKWTPKGRD